MKFPAFEAINLKNNEESLGLLSLSLTKVFPDPNQPRKNFDTKALEELSQSVGKYGVLQPIIVKKVDDCRYQIIAGERRWRASHIAGLKEIPVIIQNNDDQENFAISIIENIQREELNPIEQAEALNHLLQEHGLSHDSIASMVGKSRTTVTNLLRLLNVSQYVKNLLISGKLEIGHARTLLTLPDEEQDILEDKPTEKNLLVRDAETLVQLYKLPQIEKHNVSNRKINTWEKELSSYFSLKVSVKMNEKGAGKVMISFDCPEEVDWLVEKLTGKAKD